MHTASEAVEPSDLYLVARREVDHLCRDGRRFQPRRVGGPGGQASGSPVNLSCHPSMDDNNPAWSPDGRTIAFTGKSEGGETSIYFVYLQKAEEETDDRDRAEQRAVEKLRRARLQSGNRRSRGRRQPAGGVGQATATGRRAGCRGPRACPPQGVDRLRPYLRPHPSRGRARRDRGAVVVVARLEEVSLHGGPGRQDRRLHDQPAQQPRAGIAHQTNRQIGAVACAGQPHRVAFLRRSWVGHARQGRDALSLLGAPGIQRQPEVRGGVQSLLARHCATTSTTRG